SAIVAALAVLAGASLSGCGNRGPLYLPTVPPLPAQPSSMQTQAPSANDAAASAPVIGTIPDTSGTPLSLSPDDQLRTEPGSDSTPSTARPASGASTDQ
ncbi:MAG TPA: lipoprotein, partial [Paraburkholderia sp.]|nr:lipoprotein [Paraburkholderia sp.]